MTTDQPAQTGSTELDPVPAGALTPFPPWRPTAAQVRAVVVGAVGGVLAVVARRPDVLVLVTPLLVVAAWGRLARPIEVPSLTSHLSRRSVREGESVWWTTTLRLPEGADDVFLSIDPAPFTDLDPPLGIVAAAREDAVAREGTDGHQEQEGQEGHDPTLTARVAVRLTRWGRRPVGPVHVGADAAWAAYHCGPVNVTAAGEHVVTVLPLPATFDPTAPLPRPEGLVGAHRAGRAGGGTEFATVRAFQPGDRLRRIRWPVSLRTGNLHVSSTWADEDASVVLLVDAFSDLGPREGLDGRPTSLDLTVRAAAAMAQHHLVTGDRVAVRVIGSATVRRLPAGSGRRHLRRVLDTLASIEPATERSDDGEWSTSGIPSGALVVVLTPLVDPSSVAVVARLGSRGLTTIVLDTMPDHLWDPEGDPATRLAWRLRRLTRTAEIQRLGDLGVPVVPWRGPGSLDLVLRDVARRARRPRMVRR